MYISLNAHIFVICKYNLFKLSVIVSQELDLSFSVNISLLTFVARRSLLSDLGSHTCIFLGYKALMVQNLHLLDES